MKFEAQKDTLIELVTLVARVCGKHTALPVLQGIQLETKNARLWMRGTNLDMGVEVNLPLKVIEEGMCVVSANVLLQVISSFEKGKVHFAHIKSTLEITTPQSVLVIPCLDASEFPTLPHVGEHTVTVPAEDLRTGIRSVWFAVSHSSVKQELASVYMHMESGKLVCVGTDSFRLAEKKIQLREMVESPVNLIPIRVVPDVLKALENFSDAVVVASTPNQLSFSSEQIYITTRLIEGSFPDYQQIIPKEIETTATFLTEDIQTALKKTGIFSGRFQQVLFRIEPKKKKVTLEAQTPEIGQIHEVVPATVEGEDITVSFNQRYLLDCFSAITSESVRFSFAGAGRPLVVRGVGDNTFLYLVMPMNV